MKIYYHDKGAVYNTRTIRCGCKAGEETKVRSEALTRCSVVMENVIVLQAWVHCTFTSFRANFLEQW